MGSLIAGVLCLVGALAAPQEGVAEQGRLLERRLDFERAWQGADEAARDRVRADVDLRRRRGPGALQYTDAGQFVRWSQLLRAGSTPPVPLELQSWIGELELAFVPGCMTLAEASQPTQIVAHVTAAGGPPLPQEAGTRIRVGLDWIHPGGERLAGRREFVDLRAFRLQGFDMFLTLPAAQEGICTCSRLSKSNRGFCTGTAFRFLRSRITTSFQRFRPRRASRLCGPCAPPVSRRQSLARWARS
ncbi:MAG: hypothetical protein R3E96_09990 [Planctomycetota bacterium]